MGKKDNDETAEANDVKRLQEAVAEMERREQESQLARDARNRWNESH
jgi:hypothetical protein